MTSYNGSILSISRVNRLHMGAYLCIAQVNLHKIAPARYVDHVERNNLIFYFFSLLERNTAECFKEGDVDCSL